MFPKGLSRKPNCVALFVECVEAALPTAEIHVECMFKVIAKDVTKNFEKCMEF